MITQLEGGLLLHLRQSYVRLQETDNPFSLVELLQFNQFNLNNYCKPFHPHPQMQELIEQAERFGKRYGIWLDHARHYISCALYLFPTAGFMRMVSILKNCAIDFYLNDTIGREKFMHLSQDEQLKAIILRTRMAAVKEDLKLQEDAVEIEKANLEMLREIADGSSKSWFTRFLALYNYHLEVAHADINSAALNRILTVEEYIELRNHIAGMPHTIELIQYSIGHYIDWEDLKRRGMDKPTSRLNRYACLIGCLLNDLFSFEKEVIDDFCDANLVTILMLNHPDMLLEEAIYSAAAIVTNLLLEFTDTMAELKANLSISGQEMECLQKYTDGLEKCVQASWLWQVYTKRYKRPRSIFKETRIVEETNTLSL